MSMDLGGAKGGVKSDINVTPLVDVMLVLLIIMMLVAPMLQQGVSRQAAEGRPTRVDKPETQDQTVHRDRRRQARSTSTPSRCRKPSWRRGSTRSSRTRTKRSSSSRPTRKSSTAP